MKKSIFDIIYKNSVCKRTNKTLFEMGGFKLVVRQCLYGQCRGCLNRIDKL